MVKWDERYAGDEYFYGTEPNDFLKQHASLIEKGGRVLCLGEGEGRNAVFLARSGFAVTAVDQSPVGLDKARRLAAAHGVSITTQVADLAVFEIKPGYWHAIVSIWCHLPGALRRAVNRQVVEGLVPGGLFLLEAYTPDQLNYGTGGPKEPDLMPTLADLRNDLAPLTFQIGRELVRDVQEGRGHGGPSAVVQVLARR